MPRWVEPVRLIRVAWDHPDAVALREAMTAEVAAMYAEKRASANRDGSMGVDPATVFATVLVYDGGIPVGHAALRRLDGDLEIKRMYVPQAHRGTGIAEDLLAGMERIAREDGARRVILHTGTKQAAAIALYARHGYTEIPVYPPYVGLPDSLCFEKVFD
jgi:GNAT superfamily N-acetyltransferase